MEYLLVYHPKVKEDVAGISAPDRDMIRDAIEARLLVDPERYGKPLRKGLKGYRKLRVGDYRVVYAVKGPEIRVIIIGHRKNVYDSAPART